jgi:hypothetical protein
MITFRDLKFICWYSSSFLLNSATKTRFTFKLLCLASSHLIFPITGLWILFKNCSASRKFLEFSISRVCNRNLYSVSFVLTAVRILGVVSNSVLLKVKTLWVFRGLVKILGGFLDFGLRVWSGSFLRCLCDLRCRAQFFDVIVISHLPHVLIVFISFIYIYKSF